jgi:hypothetical protein
MYTFTLFAHSYLRWLVLGLGLTVTLRAWLAARGGRDWNPSDERWQQAFVGSVDLQLTLGLVLYCFLSPFSRGFLADVTHSIKEPTLRFFGVEHAFVMLPAVVLAHVARVRSKRLAGVPRQRQVWILTSIVLVLMLVGIPWPFLPYARPLLRF